METNIQQIFSLYYAMKNDTRNLLWNTATDVLFYWWPLIWIELLVWNYLDENYPNWRNDFDNNIKVFREKMNIILNETKVKNYLDDYLK
jgi:hypothetical protein